MRRPFGGSDRPRVLTAWCRNLAGPLALFLGHEVVGVAVATAKPEVHALGGDDIVVVAGYPAAAGAGGTRQGADGALDCGKQTETLLTGSEKGVTARISSERWKDLRRLTILMTEIITP